MTLGMHPHTQLNKKYLLKKQPQGLNTSKDKYFIILPPIRFEIFLTIDTELHGVSQRIPLAL